MSHSQPWQRRPASSKRFWTSIAVIGAGALLLALVLLGISLQPSAALTAFRAAQPCAGIPPQPAPRCWYVTQMTISHARRWSDRGGTYVDLSLTGAGPTASSRLNSYFWSNPDFHPGDQVQATVWDGRVTAIGAGGQSFTTHDSPAYLPMDERRVAASLTALGLLLLLAALIHQYWRRRRAK